MNIVRKQHAYQSSPVEYIFLVITMRMLSASQPTECLCVMMSLNPARPGSRSLHSSQLRRPRLTAAGVLPRITHWLVTAAGLEPRASDSDCGILSTSDWQRGGEIELRGFWDTSSPVVVEFRTRLCCGLSLSESRSDHLQMQRIALVGVKLCPLKKKSLKNDTISPSKSYEDPCPMKYLFENQLFHPLELHSSHAVIQSRVYT